MVVIIGSGGQAVPQTDVIILYIVENVNGYAINTLMLASGAWSDQKIRAVYRGGLGRSYRFFWHEKSPRSGGIKEFGRLLCLGRRAVLRGFSAVELLFLLCRFPGGDGLTVFHQRDKDCLPDTSPRIAEKMIQGLFLREEH